MARAEDRRVRFPAVEALAQAHVAPCVTGVRQSRDCLHPLPLRRPCAFASASPFVSGNRPHFHGDWSRPSVPRARPGHRRACAFRRRTPGLRLRGGCGAMLSSRAAPPAHPPRHPPPAAPARLASPRARPVRPLHGSAHIQSQGVCVTMVRRNFIEILSLTARTNREELLRIEFSSRLGDRVDAAVLRQGGGTPPQGRRKR